MTRSIRRRFTFRGETRTPTPHPAQSELPSLQKTPYVPDSSPNIYARCDTQHFRNRPSHPPALPTPAATSVHARSSTAATLSKGRPALDVDAIVTEHAHRIDMAEAGLETVAEEVRRFSLPARYASPVGTDQNPPRPKTLHPLQLPQPAPRTYARFNGPSCEHDEYGLFTHRVSEPTPTLTSANARPFDPPAREGPKRASLNPHATRPRFCKSDRVWWHPKSVSHIARSSSSSPSMSQQNHNSFFKSSLRGDSQHSNPHCQSRANRSRARSPRASLSKFARPFDRVRALWPFHASHTGARSHRARPPAPPTTGVSGSHSSPPASRPSSCRARRAVWPRRHPRASKTEPPAHPRVHTNHVPDPVPPFVEREAPALDTSTKADDSLLCPINSISRSDYLISGLDDRPQANPLRRLSFHAGRTRGRIQVASFEGASEPDHHALHQPRFPSLSSINCIPTSGAESTPPQMAAPSGNNPKSTTEATVDVNIDKPARISNTEDTAAFTTDVSCPQIQQKASEIPVNLQHSNLDFPPPPSLQSASDSVTQSSTFSLTNSQSLSLSLSRQSSLLDALMGSQPRLSRRALRRHDMAMRMKAAASFYQSNMGFTNNEYYHTPLISVDPTYRNNLCHVRSPTTPHGIPWSPPRRLQTHSVQQPHVCLWPAPAFTLPTATSNSVPIPMPISMSVPASTGLLPQGIPRMQTPTERPHAYLENCEWSETSTELSESRNQEKRIRRDLAEDASCEQENFLASRIFGHKGRSGASQLDRLGDVNASPPMTLLPPAIAPMPTSPPLSSDAPSDAASASLSRSMDDIFQGAVCSVAVPNGPLL